MEVNPLEMLPINGDADDGTARPGLPPRGAMDERDWPEASPWQTDAQHALGDDPAPTNTPRGDATILRPISVRHGASHVIRAQTRTITAGAAQPVLLGLEPGIAQAQNIAYLVLIVAPGAGDLRIAGNESALEGERASVPHGTAPADGPTPPLTLPGVAGVFAWATTADVVVSVLVVGEAST